MGPGHKLGFFAISALGAILSFTTVWLLLLNWPHSQARDLSDPTIGVFWTVIALVFMGTGLVVAWRRPHNAVGWLLALTGLGMAAHGALFMYSVFALVTEPGSLLGSEIAVVGQVSWLVPFIFIPILLMIYPTSTFLSARWRLGAVAAGLAALTTVASAVLSWDLRHLGARLLGEVEDVTFDPTAELVFALGLGLWFASAGVALASAVVRWRRADQVELLQMKWLLGRG